jgi:hypothetical protein
MYSILLKLTTSTSTTADKWKFYSENDSVYTANTLEDVQDKVVELMSTYLLSSIKVVKNCIITNSVTVEEVE